MKFLLITDDGTLVPVLHTTGTTLGTLQTLVDGLVDCVVANNGFDLWVNEEGLYREDFRPNRVAIRLAGTVLVGPVVMAASTREGETVGLTDEQIADFADWLGRDLAPTVTAGEAHARYVLGMAV